MKWALLRCYQWLYISPSTYPEDCSWPLHHGYLALRVSPGRRMSFSEWLPSLSHYAHCQFLQKLNGHTAEQKQATGQLINMHYLVCPVYRHACIIGIEFKLSLLSLLLQTHSLNACPGRVKTHDGLYPSGSAIFSGQNKSRCQPQPPLLQ